MFERDVSCNGFLTMRNQMEALLGLINVNKSNEIEGYLLQIYLNSFLFYAIVKFIFYFYVNSFIKYDDIFAVD